MSNFKLVKAGGPVFTELEVRVRENSYPIKIDQLYGVFVDDGEVDIKVNGSLIVEGFLSGQTCQVNATVCNNKNQILYVLNDYTKIPMKKDEYYAFSLFCYKVDRFVTPDDVAYVEVYVTITEDKKKSSKKKDEDDEIQLFM